MKTIQRQQQTSIDIAARQTGLEPHTIRRLVRVGIVSSSLTEDGPSSGVSGDSPTWRLT